MPELTDQQADTGDTMLPRDAQLAATLASGTRPHEAIAATIASVTPHLRGPALRLPSSPNRYTIVRELARGGMGRISVAIDDVLDREVALKELVRPSPELAARFVRELALTSRLQHPSIVSIHDAGTWPSGEPFYVMRLVSGESLERMVGRHATIAERLGLLPQAIAMVDALAYAHAHDIIHRDLKPANVLVGDFGETVVIDWGLAKDLRATSPDEPATDDRRARDGETMLGSVLGTPAFMAPEQALGETVDARADVYALGAVLYFMLTGTAPYSGPSLEALLARVIDEPPPPIRDAAPGIPADLATIIEKAMARTAADRYATAGELAEELKRFQRGQLVAAHRYTWLDRARRWFGRHRAAAYVAAAAIVVVTAIGAASIRSIVHERRNAEAARDRAVYNRTGAEDLMEFMVVTLRESFEATGKLQLLEAPARKALAYYASHDLSTVLDVNQLAVAHKNLADVLAARGESVAAQGELLQSLMLQQYLFSLTPITIRSSQPLASSHDRLGEILGAKGDRQGALRWHETGLAVIEPIATGSKDPEIQRDLFVSLFMVGATADQSGEVRKAAAAFGRARTIAVKLAADSPKDPDAQRDLMASEQRLGIVQQAQGDLAAAMTSFQAAVALSERLLAAAPDDVERMRDHAQNRDAVARVLLARQDVPPAIVEIRASMALFQQLLANEPNSVIAQRDLVEEHARLGSALTARGADPEGELELRTAIDVAAHLVEVEPTNAQSRRDLASMRSNLGLYLETQHHHANALAQFQAAYTIVSELATTHHETPWRLALVISHRNLGLSLLGLERHDEALAEAKAAVAEAQRLAEESPGDVQIAFQLASCDKLLGKTLVTHEPASAQAAWREAQTILARLIQQDASNAEWQEAKREVDGLIAAT